MKIGTEYLCVYKAVFADVRMTQYTLRIFTNDKEEWNGHLADTDEDGFGGLEDTYSVSPESLYISGLKITWDDSGDDDVTYRKSQLKVDIIRPAAIVTKTATQHYVRLLRGVGDDEAIVWQGYMEPSVITQPIGAAAESVTYSAVSALGVLDGITTQCDSNYITLRQLLQQAYTSSGEIWKLLYVPHMYTPYDGEGHAGNILDVAIDANSIKEEVTNDDGSSYKKGKSILEVLRSVLTVYGWQLVDVNNNLVMYSPICDTYDAYLADSLYGDFSTLIGPMEGTDVIGIQAAGEDHKEDIEQGVNSIRITCELNSESELLPSISTDDFEYKELSERASATTSQTGTPSSYAYELLYADDSNNGDVAFYHYHYTRPHDDNYIGIGKYDDEANVVYEGEKMYDLLAAGAWLVRGDSYKTKDGKNNYSLSDYIVVVSRLPYLQLYNATYERKWHDISSRPLCTVRNKALSSYDYGAIVLDFGVEYRYMTYSTGRTYYDSTFGVESFQRLYDWRTPDTTITITCKLRVANRWLINDAEGGYKWTSEDSTFDVCVNNGTILTNKTLDMPYDVSSGIVMPILDGMVGDIEFSLLGLVNPDSSNPWCYRITGLSLRFAEKLTAAKRARTQDNNDNMTISAKLDKEIFSTQRRDIDIDYCCSAKNVCSPRLLLFNNQALACVQYGESKMSIESALLGIQKQRYCRNYRRLYVQLTDEHLYDGCAMIIGRRYTYNGGCYSLMGGEVDVLEARIDATMEEV